MRHIKSLLIASVSLALFACGGSKEQEIHETAETVTPVKDTTPVTVTDTTKFKFDFAIANIPSPANSMNEIVKWGHAYDNSIFNHSKNIEKYTSEYQKAINLGVYNIDMAYAMVSDNGEDVIKYMKNVMMLSDALGLKAAVNSMVGKRAENNISNRDSLFKILDEIFVKSDEYLRTNERVYTAANIFAGSWVESLYIVSEIGTKTTDANVKSQVHKYLWDQRFYLGNIITLLDDYRDKKETADLIAELKPIHEEINAVKDPKEMNDAKFKSISEKIIKLREKLTN
jgi:hypothetical protein